MTPFKAERLEVISDGFFSTLRFLAKCPCGEMSYVALDVTSRPHPEFLVEDLRGRLTYHLVVSDGWASAPDPVLLDGIAEEVRQFYAAYTSKEE